MANLLLERFVPELKSATALVKYAEWRKQRPGEARKWDAYLQAIQAFEAGGAKPLAPELGSHFGKMLVAAGELQVSVTDLGAVYPPGPDPEPDPATPVFTTNITNGQAITQPFTWTADVEPAPTSMEFWADGVLLATDATAPYEHALDLTAGSHVLGLCAWHDQTRTCLASAPGETGFARVDISGPGTPPSGDYDYRFATFNPTTDAISGTLNRYQPAYSWWVPGSPPGTAWPNGGGLHEITTPFGPGIRIVDTSAMLYPQSPDSHLGRYAMFHNTANFRGQTQRWEWTWHWPSSGNLSGWSNNWVTAEGLTFAHTISGTAQVGHHLYLDYGNPMRFRFGRHTGLQTWQFTLSSNSGVTFPADTYVHMRLDIKWTENTDGFIRCYSQHEGGSEVQWMSYSGVTLPSTWNVWTVYQNIRTMPLTWSATNTLDFINNRLTLL